ncbi:hypothetical protein [Megasphaera sp. UBA4382]|uniref:hypothetical protein n=1 Tax=Megasphaera sp. UBA4382 TaxID=1946850 RepID=UPI0025B954C6|nr:hypothetical protein [Megasphaera sp. UBA4382]
MIRKIVFIDELNEKNFTDEIITNLNSMQNDEYKVEIQYKPISGIRADSDESESFIHYTALILGKTDDK